jgi:hypothetical protein
MTDAKAALLFYLNDRPDEIKAALQGFAEADVRAGRRSIPGFTIEEETRVV